MVNSSLLQTNMTEVSILSDQLIEYSLIFLILLMVLGYIFFTCFITMILSVFFMTPHLRDSARYVLFVYMLVDDTYYLYSGFFFLLSYIYELHIPVPLCFFLYTLTNITAKVTPYNLAAMAIEQYVAICHPLRHAELCTTYRARVAFTVIFSWLTIPPAVELFVMVSSMTNIFSLYIICKQNMLVVNPIQNVIRSINLTLCFSLVGLIILATYIKIMLVALKVTCGSPLASKAGRTVMLHAFQLLLCMASLLSTLTASFQIRQSDLQNLFSFFIFTCVPRFLSPVLYGIRDEVLRKHLKMVLPHFIRNVYGKSVVRVSR